PSVPGQEHLLVLSGKLQHRHDDRDRQVMGELVEDVDLLPRLKLAHEALDLGLDTTIENLPHVLADQWHPRLQSGVAEVRTHQCPLARVLPALELQQTSAEDRLKLPLVVLARER